MKNRKLENAKNRANGSVGGVFGNVPVEFPLFSDHFGSSCGWWLWEATGSTLQNGKNCFLGFFWRLSGRLVFVEKVRHWVLVCCLRNITEWEDFHG